MSLSLSNLNSSLALLRSSSLTTVSSSTPLASLRGRSSIAPTLASSVAIPKARDSYVSGLLSGTKWSNPNLTYGFPGTATAYEYTGEAQNNFHPLNASQITAVEKALRAYGSVANITFASVDGSVAGTADLRFASSDSPSTAWAYMPTSSPQGGDVWFRYSGGQYSDPRTGTYAYDTVLHEIGHALGLKHAHETSGVMPVLPKNHQSMEYTVMSYSSYLGASNRSGYTNQTDSYAQTPMMDDIAALQAIYGANFSTNDGNTTYSWSPTTGEMSVNAVGQGTLSANRIFMTIWDGNGEDTYDFSQYTTNLKVDLNPGGWTIASTGQLADLKHDGTKKAIGNIANAKLYQKDIRSLIENAYGGSGNDILLGNQANNRLVGGVGNDMLTGGGGNDVLIGGSGSDTLDGGSGVDTVDYSSAASGVTLDLLKGGTGGEANGDLYKAIERAIGTAYGDLMFGGSLAEELLGGDGSDTLSGGGGKDALQGGTGHDRLWGGAGADILTGGAGRDTFQFKSVSEIGKLSGVRDIIMDFSTTDDTIDLSSMDANIRTSGIQSFEYLSAEGASFTSAGQIRIRHVNTAAGATTLIEGNVDASLGADFAIELRGSISGLTSANFIF